MGWKSDKFGEKLISKGGKINSEDLELGENDVIGLYFSAHWCPPCRGFTPKLVEFYKEQNEKSCGPKLKIIFVSADKSPGEFEKYYGEMPWHALPFDQKDVNGELCDQCNVRGIPMLVLYDSKGERITTLSDARSMVTNDPAGDRFPWKV